MSGIDTRTPFFVRSRSAQTEAAKNGNRVGGAERNSTERASELMDRTASDAKVNIPEGVKEFSRIKKAALNAPEQDNSEKIARLKAQIQAGTYEVDYDGLADKILSSEI
jgi:negative regulator of flagellin synthesis FlgM